jgi:hypothetical protein
MVPSRNYHDHSELRALPPHNVEVVLTQPRSGA